MANGIGIRQRRMERLLSTNMMKSVQKRILILVIFSDSEIKTVSFNPLDNCKESVYIVPYTIEGDKITATQKDGKIVVVTYKISRDELLIVFEKEGKEVYKRL